MSAPPPKKNKTWPSAPRLPPNLRPLSLPYVNPLGHIPSSKISHPWKDRLQSPASVNLKGLSLVFPSQHLRTPPSLLQKTPGSFLFPLFRHFLHCPCKMKIKGESESWEGWRAGGEENVPSLLSGREGGSSHIRVWKFHCSFLIPAAFFHFSPPTLVMNPPSNSQHFQR